MSPPLKLVALNVPWLASASQCCTKFVCGTGYSRPGACPPPSSCPCPPPQDNEFRSWARGVGMAEGQTVVLRKLAPARFSISIAPRSGVGAGASAPAAAVASKRAPPPPALPAAGGVPAQRAAQAVGSKRQRQATQEPNSAAVADERPRPARQKGAEPAAGRQRLPPLEQQREQAQRQQQQPQPQHPEIPGTGAAVGWPGAGAGAGAGGLPPADEVAIYSEALALAFQVSKPGCFRSACAAIHGSKARAVCRAAHDSCWADASGRTTPVVIGACLPARPCSARAWTLTQLTASSPALCCRQRHCRWHRSRCM